MVAGLVEAGLENSRLEMGEVMEPEGDSAGIKRQAPILH
jgi:hypothetical protein